VSDNKSKPNAFSISAKVFVFCVFLGKEFERLFDNWKGVQAQNPPCTYQKNLEANIDRVWNLLNCPNDTLDGVLIPNRYLNNNLFGIS